MSPSVFISRSDERAATFIEAVEPYSSKIIAESLLSFSNIAVDSIPETDWLFFYSQTGADYFFKQHPKFDNLQVAAFGPKTGNYIQAKYHKVDFIGDGQSESTARTFLSNHDPKRICIVRGQASINSLYTILKSDCNLSEMIVYQNAPKSTISLEKTDILVFTSPLNLETYFDTYGVDISQKVIVIGSTTAMAALKHGLDEVHIASKPSMESLAESTIKLCQTWSDI